MADFDFEQIADARGREITRLLAKIASLEGVIQGDPRAAARVATSAFSSHVVAQLKDEAAALRGELAVAKRGATTQRIAAENAKAELADEQKKNANLRKRLSRADAELSAERARDKGPRMGRPRKSDGAPSSGKVSPDSKVSP